MLVFVRYLFLKTQYISFRSLFTIQYVTIQTLGNQDDGNFRNAAPFNDRYGR